MHLALMLRTSASELRTSWRPCSAQGFAGRARWPHAPVVDEAQGPGRRERRAREEQVHGRRGALQVEDEQHAPRPGAALRRRSVSSS
jgi:hypothetical protein